jgi:hypothetical protein
MRVLGAVRRVTELCFNKECICWQRSFELIKMHGKTTTKKMKNNVSNLGFTLISSTENM